MKRLFITLKNEFKLARTAIPIHLVAIIQPTAMYVLMSVILVHPTFDMYVTRPDEDSGRRLVEAMGEVGSPIGDPYINPIIIEKDQFEGLRQVVSVEEMNGHITAVQEYGLIDSNIVKNFRNRLTAAALRIWNDSLGNKAVQIREHPWLPRDMPYTLYFGMAMLPLTAAIAASIVGGTLTAQEFELGTILEYRLSPTSAWLVISIRLIRLTLTGLISSSVLLVAIWFVNNVWPSNLWQAVFVLIPIGIVGGSLGIIVGVLFQKSIPAFLVGLVFSFVTWLVGSAFGLAAGFSRAYEFVSRLTTNTHAVELLYPLYFGTGVGTPWFSALFLLTASVFMICLAVWAYRFRVHRQI